MRYPLPMNILENSTDVYAWLIVHENKYVYKITAKDCAKEEKHALWLIKNRK